MTRRGKKRGARRKRSGTRGTAIYVRCRFCGREFEGNSDKVLGEWSEHVGPCEEKHEKSLKASE